MRRLGTLLLCAACLFAIPILIRQGRLAQEEKVKAQLFHDFPTSEEKISLLSQHTQKNLVASIDEFCKIPIRDRTYENTVEKWDRIGREFVNKLFLLKYTCLINSSEKIIEVAERALLNLYNFFQEKLQNSPEVVFSMLSYMEKAIIFKNLTESQWHTLHQISQSLHEKIIPDYLKDRVGFIQRVIASHSRKPYSYLPGKGPCKKQLTNFTLLSLNVCFLPENQPLILGGILPWKKRIKGILTKITRVEPDIVCLQEVFDDEAASVLFTALSKKYSHFYLKIGPRNFGFNEQTLGVNSGLFIASKYEITHPTFTLFSETPTPMNRGVFDFIIQGEKGKKAHIYTTHLEPFSSTPGPEFREKQLRKILQKIQNDLQEPISCIFCGDLNISFGSKEQGEKLLQTYFFDPYNVNRKQVSMACRTVIDYSSFWRKGNSHLSCKPDILDYTLFLKQKPFTDESYTHIPHLTTTVISMNDPDTPFTALSDHQGQLSFIHLK